MRRSLLPLAAVATLALAGCGKSAVPNAEQTQAGTQTIPGEATTLLGSAGSGGLSTGNTSRLGGATPVQDAAAIARAIYPGLTPATRPQAVVIVNSGEWSAALAASALSGAPLHAPILYSEGGTLPAVSATALQAMAPTGARALGGAQVIAIGSAPSPPSYRTLALRAATPYALAARIARLLARLHGGSAPAAILAGASAEPALSMPAAGLAAESETPILLLGAHGVPAATRTALRALRTKDVYAIGPPTAIGESTLLRLQRLAEATRIGAGGAVTNAIKVAAFATGGFGFGVDEPGHGLAFALASRPLDAPAAALLAASADYAPLLLLSSSEAVPPELERYLRDIQPAYGRSAQSLPVRGVYNRGWLVGDQRAISVKVQAQLDSLLRSVPRATPSASPSLLP
jgi:hypothetical protein